LFRDIFVESKLNSLKNKLSEEKNKKKLRERKYSELKFGSRTLNKKEIDLLKNFINQDGVIDEIKFKKVINKEFDQITKEETVDEDLSYFFRLPIDSSFYKNFLFFNTSTGILTQEKKFLEVLCSSSKEEVLSRIDKTINKLLASERDFFNVFYCSTSIENLKEKIRYLFVYLLCFTYAFENFKNIGHILFYSNVIRFTYSVNKGLKLRKRRLEEMGRLNSDKFFKITWNEIINVLIQYKSEWNLENMYFIRYKRLDNRSQEDVEYISIPKLQASIILDDKLRSALNNNLKIKGKESKNKEYVWLLEEFIKGKSLYSLMLQYIRACLNEKTKLNFSVLYSVLYSLLIDAAILEFKHKQNDLLFSTDFFDDSYREIIKKVKDEFRSIYYYSNELAKSLSDSKDKLSYLLLDALFANNKSLFLNTLLKSLNNVKKLDSLLLENLIFNKIVYNKVSWQRYALCLVAKMVV